MANFKQFVDTSDWGCDTQQRVGPSRRGFMKGGALALVGTSVIPSFPAAQRDGRGDDGGRRAARSWWCCFSGGRRMG